MFFVQSLTRKRKSDGVDSICSSNPKKASKSGKAENVLPAIQEEYGEHLTNLSEGNLEKEKLSKDVTAWGKRKGVCYLPTLATKQMRSAVSARR